MNEQGPSLTPSLERLRADILGGRLDRRAVLKRGAALGLSAPLIASLLAACGGSVNKATATTASGATGGSTPTTGAAASTSTTGGTSATPTTSGTSSSPTTAPASPSASGGSGSGTGSTPGHGRGKADLLRILYWQAPTILNVHFSQGTKYSAASSLVPSR